MKSWFLYSIALLTAAGLSSCAWFDKQPEADLVTDIPQMALYAAAFNTSQTRYKIHVVYQDRIAEQLPAMKKKPALLVGRYLKNSKTSPLFISLDHLFSELVLNQSSIYPCLLDLGNVEGRQLFLPVSFNIPLVVFDKRFDTDMKDGFVLDAQELEEKGAAFNKSSRGSYTSMGFGPRWSSEFLYAVMDLMSAGFRESAPLSWSPQGLEAGIAYARAWSEYANSSINKEDDFQFKYLYLPMYKSVEEGRIGYAAMPSSDYFIVSEERRSALSFRWFSKNSQIPVADDIVYAGICRAGSGRQAAEAFLKWFYSEAAQRAMLADAMRYRSMETSFGIAGGFSAVKAINEKVFPLYYPSLLGRLPPASYLKAPNVLPAIWPDIKKTVLLPFLLEATGPTPMDKPSEALEARIQAWLKRHPVN